MVTKLKIINYLIFGTLASLNLASAQENLSELTWGIRNTGKSQQLSIDHFTSANLLGIQGEDIQVPENYPNARLVTVAVLDTGIDYHHPQLKPILAGPGYNAVNPKLDANDTLGHGTHVAGLIAAPLDASGFQGVSSHIKILPVKVMMANPNAPVRPQGTEPDTGTALTETVAKGLTWAIQNGAEVVNLSMAWPSSIHSNAMDDAIALATQKKILVVSSAGNDGTNADVYPCIYETVICVGAHGPGGALTHFSNYGSMVDLVAPGVSILSTWPGSLTPKTFAGQIGYEFKDGTSMAAPFVTGALAELLSRGFSPMEARARILLGTRPTAKVNQFTSVIQGVFSHDHLNESKSVRFGNLDIMRALALTQSPLILPQIKGLYKVEWDGVSQTITVPIAWNNFWMNARDIKIKVDDQSFNFPLLGSGTNVVTPISVFLGENPPQIIHLMGSVETENYQKNNIEITLEIIRVIRENSLPKSAKVFPISGLAPKQYSGIRSVINQSKDSTLDYVFTRMVKIPPSVTANALELAIIRDHQFYASSIIPNMNEDQLFNFYRLPDLSYAAVFSKSESKSARPDYFVEKFDAEFKLLSEAKISTLISQLSESLTWLPFKNTYTLFWISKGLTPEADALAYDPWNPQKNETNYPHLYYLDGTTLRIVKFNSDEIPLQVLPNGQILISKGNSYFQKYYSVDLKDEKAGSRTELVFPVYRMLIGLTNGSRVLHLDGTPSDTISISGASSPGNLRVTEIGSSPIYDQIISRPSVFDAIENIPASFSDSKNHYYFAQTHNDLKFFKSGSDETLSTSLNRYSYIPSMVFARNFFPTLVTKQDGTRLPAVYIPATIANGFVSEIIVADLAHNKLFHPAQFKFKIKDENCDGLGNLIAATTTEPAKQVFICGNQMIQIPLQMTTTSE